MVEPIEMLFGADSKPWPILDDAENARGLLLRMDVFTDHVVVQVQQLICCVCVCVCAITV